MGEVDSDGNPVELTDDEKEGDGQLGDESVDAGRVETGEDVTQEVKDELREAEQKPKARASRKAASKPAESADKVMVDGADTPKRRGRKPAVKQEEEA